MIQARCDSCRAAIEWAVSRNGKRQPFDAEPVPEGTYLLVHRKGPGEPAEAQFQKKAAREELAAYAAERGSELRLFMPHHATCPDAAAWRR